MGNPTTAIKRYSTPDYAGNKYRILVAILAFAALPQVLRDITLLQLSGALFFAIFVISWDIVSGYTGYISFGHTLLYGTAGYASALLNIHLGLDPVLSIPIAVLITVFVSGIIGFPTLRLEGPYFSLFTLIAPLVLLSILILFSSYTGGERGLLGVEKISLDPVVNYYVAYFAFLLVFVTAYVITRSGLGVKLEAIREEEDVVSASGIDPIKFKIISFGLSSALGGFGAAVYVHTAVGSAAPTRLLAIPVMASVIIAAIIGGTGTITGAAIGGLLFFSIREQIRGIEWHFPLTSLPVSELHLIILYVGAIGLLLAAPNGLVPWTIQRLREVEAK